jgi:autotransporter-associated beta strand protein
LLYTTQQFVNDQKTTKKRKIDSMAKHVQNSMWIRGFATMMAMTVSVHAGSLTWDGNGSTTPNPNGGTGNWDVNSTATWWNGTANVVWPALGGTDDDAVFANTAGTVSLTTPITANGLTFNTTGYLLQGNTLTLNGTTPTITTAASVSATIDSVLAGTSLTKAGAGTLTLTAANTYNSTTTISAGTLALSNGNNRLPTGTTVNFSGTSSLDLGSTSQTLANMTVANNVTGTVKGTGGTLALGGAAFQLGSATASSAQTLTLAALSTFTYTGSTRAFNVGGLATGGNGAAGTLTLAATNAITAASIGLGIGGTYSTANAGTMNMGRTNVINASTILIGGNYRSNGTLQYPAGTTDPTLTLRGTDGASRITSMIIGDCNGPSVASFGKVDLTSNVTGFSTLDALIGTLVIGRNSRASSAGGNYMQVTGSFTMGDGTLDATSITLGQVLALFSDGGTTSYTTGTVSVASGTMKVATLTLGDHLSAANANSGTCTGIFTLDNGATLAAQTIQPGAGASKTTRLFNWNDGTIKNYGTGTNLTISGLTTFALLGTGLHAFDIDAGCTGTVNQVISGAGSLTKLGGGTLRLAAANSYSGATVISNGTLEVSASGSLLQPTELAIYTNAQLTILNTGNVLNNSATLSLVSGAKVELANGVNETIRLLLINGQPAAAGTWGTVNCQWTNTALFAGAGVLTVTSQAAYTITASADPVGGTITPSGAIQVATDSSTNFVITATNAGYHVSNVVVDGISIGATNAYTFADVIADHTITVAFELRPQYSRGSITWDNNATDNQWSGISGAPLDQGWQPANDAVFETTPGTVSVAAGGVTAHNITFTASGFTIQDNTLTLAGTNPTISLGAGINANIGSSIAGSSGLIKSGSGTLTLSGANTYTGNTILGGGKLAYTTDNTGVKVLYFGATAGNTTVSSIDLTDATVTTTDVTVQTDSANTNTVTIGTGKTLTSNGAVTIGPGLNQPGSNTKLSVTGAGTWNVVKSGGTFQVGKAAGSGGYGTSGNTTYLNLSGLGTFNANMGSTGTFRVGDIAGDGSSMQGSSAILAATSTITAGTLSLGDATTAGSVQSLKLGSGTQILNVNTLNIGMIGTVGRSSGSLTFNSSSGTLKVRAANGTGSAALNMYTGNIGTGVLLANVFDVTGHSADLLFSTANLMCGTMTGVNPYTSTFSFDTGTLGITTLNLGSKAGTGVATNVATLNIGSSGHYTNTASLGAVTMANMTTTAGGIAARLNITGSNTTAAITSLTLAARSAAGTVISTLSLTGGSLTVGGNIVTTGSGGTVTTTVNLDGGTLDMSGHAIGGSGQLISNLIFASGTLKNVSEINAGAGLTKTSTNTLYLAGANTYTGATTIREGTLLGVVGGSCPNSAVTVTNTPGSIAAMGVFVSDNTLQWTCSSLSFTTNGSGAQLQFSFAVDPSTTLAPLNITGSLSFDGAPLVVVDTTHLVKNRSYPLLVVGGTAPTEVPPLSPTDLGGYLTWRGPGNKTLAYITAPRGTLVRFR